MLNKKIVDELIQKYPLLSVVLKAGLLNRKTLVGTLDLDIWLADDICNKLVLAGAIEYRSNRNFIATDEMTEYLKSKREELWRNGNK